MSAWLGSVEPDALAEWADCEHDRRRDYPDCVPEGLTRDELGDYEWPSEAKQSDSREGETE